MLRPCGCQDTKMRNKALIDEVKLLLDPVLKPSYIEIADESDLHIGHAGNTGGAHLSLYVVSKTFINQTRIERHKLVYKTLDGLIPSRIHAIKIQALNEEEI